MFKSPFMVYKAPAYLFISLFISYLLSIYHVLGNVATRMSQTWSCHSWSLLTTSTPALLPTIQLHRTTSIPSNAHICACILLKLVRLAHCFFCILPFFHIPILLYIQLANFYVLFKTQLQMPLLGSLSCNPHSGRVDDSLLYVSHELHTHFFYTELQLFNFMYVFHRVVTYKCLIYPWDPRI